MYSKFRRLISWSRSAAFITNMPLRKFQQTFDYIVVCKWIAILFTFLLHCLWTPSHRFCLLIIHVQMNQPTRKPPKFRQWGCLMDSKLTDFVLYSLVNESNKCVYPWKVIHRAMWTPSSSAKTVESRYIYSVVRRIINTPYPFHLGRKKNLRQMSWLIISQKWIDRLRAREK